ncbi:hypothetical protein [Campylobacter portucalensis]|nr:hypothetical protein [Campylobacter portucalensis]
MIKGVICDYSKSLFEVRGIYIVCKSTNKIVDKIKNWKSIVLRF